MRFFEIINDTIVCSVVANNQNEAVEIAKLALGFIVDETAWVNECWTFLLKSKFNHVYDLTVSIDLLIANKPTGYFIDKQINYDKDYLVNKFVKFSVREYYLNIAIKQAIKNNKLKRNANTIR